MAIGQQRGPKPLTARDWLFGSRPRRLALKFVLENEPGRHGWTKTDIAHHCSVDRHGGARGHLEGLVAIGLIREEHGRYWPIQQGRLRGYLSKLLVELENVPDLRVQELLRERR